MSETNPFLVDAIDEAITEAVRANKQPIGIEISEPMWPGFKGSVPRNERRQWQGSRFINAYRGVPITIHDEWSWGWQLRIEGEQPMGVEE